MPLKFKCQFCGTEMTEKEKSPGEKTVCPGCRKDIEVPTDLDMLTFVPGDKSKQSDVPSVKDSQYHRPLFIKGVIIVAIALNIITSLYFSLDYLTAVMSEEISSSVMALIGPLQAVSIIFLIAIWYMRKWGWVGYLIFAVVILILSLILIPMPESLKSVVGIMFSLLLLYFIYASEKQYLQ